MTLVEQITEAENALRIPARDEILAGLKWLLDTGISYPVSLPHGEEEDAYLAVLKNVPVCGLRKVLSKIRNGQYENFNYAFIPLPAELAAMSRAEAKTERDDLVRLRETRQTLESNTKPAVHDEATKARIGKMLEAFRAEHRARKEAERGVVVEEEDSPEQIERWEKIMAMPDAARELSADEIAHRRTVSAKLDKAEQNEAAA